MANPPRIFGKEMRSVGSWPTCTEYEFDGFRLIRYHCHPRVPDCNVFVSAEKTTGGGVMYQSESEGVAAIERAITRIREAVGRLGT